MIPDNSSGVRKCNENQYTKKVKENKDQFGSRTEGKLHSLFLHAPSRAAKFAYSSLSFQ